jgi:hypothetical protein
MLVESHENVHLVPIILQDSHATTVNFYGLQVVRDFVQIKLFVGG